MGRGTDRLPVSRRAVRWVPLLLAVLATVPVVTLRAGLLAETDTFWQIRTGALTLQQRAIPSADPFSWTAHGDRWTLNSWGFDVALALANAVAGLAGVALLGAALVLAVAVMMLRLAVRLGAAPVVGASVFLVTSPFLVAWFSVRPQLVDYVSVLVLLLLLARLIERPQPRRVLAVAALTVVWVNLHAAALLAIGITGGVAVVQLISPRTRREGIWCMGAACAAAGACAASPYGLGLFGDAVHVASASSGVIVEWQRINMAKPQEDVLLTVGLLGLFAAVRRGDRLFVGALAVTAIAGVIAVRFLPVLALIALPILAAWVSNPKLLNYLRSRRVVLIPAAVIGVGALGVYAAPSLGHLGRPAPWLYPSHAVRDIPPGCRLVNTYILGGYVLYERPDVEVSIDSRNDLYGAARVAAADRLTAGLGDVNAELRGVDCVLVPPDSGLARQLRANPRWWIRSSEKAATLFLRTAVYPGETSSAGTGN